MLYISNLHKSFAKKNILEQISLQIGGGTCYALLGKNGVGKTTLINCLLDLIQPDSGEITIFGKKYSENATEIKQNLGVVAENNPLIQELTGYQYLEFSAMLYKIPKSEVANRIQSLASFFFEQIEELRKPIARYSTGMKKKIALCAAVLHKPAILVLDEPFSGLDLVAADQLIKFLQFYLNPERLIFLSSHDLNYVNKLATHIGVLDKQRLLFDGKLEEFTQNGTNYIDEALFTLLVPQNVDLGGLNWLQA